MSASRPRRSRSAAATGVSWLALLAATTVGSAQFGQVRAQVSLRSGQATTQRSGSYRLIVQSYAARSVAAGHFPGERARPLGSTQRAVTAEQLERGVSVDVLNVGVDQAQTADSVVVAWVEPGLPNLEFDALTARPALNAVYGVSRPGRGSGALAKRVVLERRYGAA